MKSAVLWKNAFAASVNLLAVCMKILVDEPHQTGIFPSRFRLQEDPGTVNPGMLNAAFQLETYSAEDRIVTPRTRTSAIQVRARSRGRGRDGVERGWVGAGVGWSGVGWGGGGVEQELVGAGVGWSQGRVEPGWGGARVGWFEWHGRVGCCREGWGGVGRGWVGGV